MLHLAGIAMPVPADARASRRHRRSTPALRRRLLASVRERCENRPGVYRMLGAEGAVIYVGQSRTLRARLLSYFRAAGRGNRQAAILREAFSLEWDYTPDELGSLLLELRLIKRHRPVWNVSRLEDEWPRAWVALTRGPVPALRLVRRTDDPEAEALWGPFRRVTELAAAVRALAEVTGVRDCPLPEDRVGFAAGEMRGRGKRRFAARPGCLRVGLGTCAGPCVGGGEAAAYARSVESARAFLDARSREPLAHARARMRRAASELAFERAAAFRDRAERLAWLARRVAAFRASMDRLTFRYVARDDAGGAHVYLLRRGTVRAEMPLPTTREAVAELEARARAVYAAGERDAFDLPPHDLEEFYVVSSFFRRRPDALADTAPGL